MKLVCLITAGSVSAAIILTLLTGLTGRAAEKEIWFGMCGPLITSIVFQIALLRHKSAGNSGKLTPLLIKAFAGKFVFFAIYIAVFLINEWVQPKLFVVCFAGFYLALHLVEAHRLHRMRPSPTEETPQPDKSQEN